jgi:hypothetical protein
MKTIILAAAAALFAVPAIAQTPPPAAAAPAGLSAESLVLPGATLAPDCGNRADIKDRALCVSAPLAGIGALADAYVADFQSKGWIAAGGDENRVIFVHRLADGGGCLGLQMQAFYDTTRPATPETTGYLAFAPVPGNVCATPPQEQPAAPAPQQ